ncbi:putative autotransporter beta-domain [Burkholderiales bacterium GJ-E10]|nr:putative autotransporter beta-domain [Burkholderiales bacterium GJ-E10]
MTYALFTRIAGAAAAVATLATSIPAFAQGESPVARIIIVPQPQPTPTPEPQPAPQPSPGQSH